MLNNINNKPVVDLTKPMVYIRKMETINVIEKASTILGSQAKLAKALGVTNQAVTKWKRRIPAERVLEIEAATKGGVTRHELRPDIYPESTAA